ncbi:MAG: HIT family protein [Pseudomonadota bacterium]|nr:HIT family protein [Pseudomonadota bacterium]
MSQGEIMECELCSGPGGVVLWAHEHLRVVLIDDLDYPGYCRVIWDEHIAEMTDLSVEQGLTIMEVVFGVESALRRLFHPDKVNLASLGNMTPHLHWHVIPRFLGDRHFPQPIWGMPQREVEVLPQVDLQKLKEVLGQILPKGRVE